MSTRAPSPPLGPSGEERRAAYLHGFTHQMLNTLVSPQPFRPMAHKEEEHLGRVRRPGCLIPCPIRPGVRLQRPWGNEDNHHPAQPPSSTHLSHDTGCAPSLPIGQARGQNLVFDTPNLGWINMDPLEKLMETKNPPPPHLFKNILLIPNFTCYSVGVWTPEDPPRDSPLKCHGSHFRSPSL